MSIEEAITSYFFANRLGMMPSQSWFWKVQVAFNSSHIALAISMSKPVISPDGAVNSNGAYEASEPNLIVIGAAGAPAAAGAAAVFSAFGAQAVKVKVTIAAPIQVN